MSAEPAPRSGPCALLQTAVGASMLLFPRGFYDHLPGWPCRRPTASTC